MSEAVSKETLDTDTVAVQTLQASIEMLQPSDAEILSEYAGYLLGNRTLKALARRLAADSPSEATSGSAGDLIAGVLLGFCVLASRRPGGLPKREAIGPYAARALANQAYGSRRPKEVTLRDHTEDLMATADMRMSTASAESDALSNLMLGNPRLMAALEALPVRQRTAVTLRYLEDRSETEVAELMGISIGSVKSTTSRGVASLRRLMTQSTEVD